MAAKSSSSDIQDVLRFTGHCYASNCIEYTVLLLLQKISESEDQTNKYAHSWGCNLAGITQYHHKFLC